MYRSILVPLDGSSSAEQALAVASSLAARMQSDIALVHVHRERIVDELPAFGLTGSDARDAAENYVLAAAERLRDGSVRRVTGTVLDGSPADAIATHVVRLGTDLIVISSHGRTGASRFWLGSVTDSLIRCATVPVLMIRAGTVTEAASRGLFQRVLVPLDGSWVAEEVLPHAVALAGIERGHLHLLQVEERAEDLRGSVWALAAHEPDDLPARLERADRYLHGVMARLQSEPAPVTVSAEARGGHRIGETIAHVATERAADLIAMTTHGRGASRLLLGSVADKVIRGTACSMLILRRR